MKATKRDMFSHVIFVLWIFCSVISVYYYDTVNYEQASFCVDVLCAICKISLIDQEIPWRTLLVSGLRVV